MQEVKQPNKKPFIFYYMIALIVIILINSLLVPQIVQRAVKEVDYNTFMQMTYDKQIDEVQIQDNQIVFTAKNDKTIYKHTEKIRQILSFMPYAQIIFISAKTGQRLPKLFENIDTVIENQTLRIQTGVLNEILSEAVALQQPPSDRGRRLKIFYMTQVAVKPPTFVIFVNDKELMHFSYVRYLENKIRDAFGFSGTSLKFIIRERGEKE